METVFADPYKYILNGDGREELYDLREDPGEARDLAVAKEVESILPLLRQHAGATRDR
jgi:hypothetical protein